jgi:hypothetical protein
MGWHMDNLVAQPENPRLDAREKVLHALQGIRYGSVEIVIHDSRIVQIERKEKVRLDVEGNGKR